REILMFNLNETCKIDFKPNFEFAKKYYDKFPVEYLYKYRKVNIDNIKAMLGNYLWCSKAKYFDDELDFTVDFNLHEHDEEISKARSENIKRLIFREFTKRKLIKFDEEYAINFVEIFLYKDGRIKHKQLETFLLNNGTDKIDVDKAINKLKE